MPVTSFHVNPEYAVLTELIPGLYICGVSSLQPDKLTQCGITHIINATNEVPRLKSLKDFLWIKLWLDDTPETNIYPHLELQSDQIREIITLGGKVLVHCVAGVSRSATICLAYLTKYRCQTLRDAYHLMASKRPLVRPNIGFWKQLIAFEQNIKGKTSSVKLLRDDAQEYGLLPDVYLKEVTPDRNEETENCCKTNEILSRSDAKQNANRSLSVSKFRPVLESLPELTETVLL